MRRMGNVAPVAQKTTEKRLDLHVHVKRMMSHAKKDVTCYAAKKDVTC